MLHELHWIESSLAFVFGYIYPHSFSVLIINKSAAEIFVGPVSQRLMYGYQICMCLNAVRQFGVTCIEFWPLLKHSIYLSHVQWQVVNPRRACAARVTVVVLCVCVCVCQSTALIC